MISIDSAVELMIKTSLGLPRRIPGREISRKAYDEWAQSWPKRLAALETYAAAKSNGSDLGEIEWYHRLRHELYHQGHGLAVEREKGEGYAELGNLLFENLFGFRLVEPEDDRTKVLGDFMAAWIDFERVLAPLQSETMRPRAPLDLLRRLRADAVVSASELVAIEAIRRVRNEVIYGGTDHKTALPRGRIERLGAFTQTIRERLGTDGGAEVSPWRPGAGLQPRRTPGVPPGAWLRGEPGVRTDAPGGHGSTRAFGFKRPVVLGSTSVQDGVAISRDIGDRAGFVAQ
jgi:hypothetical protein